MSNVNESQEIQKDSVTISDLSVEHFGEESANAKSEDRSNTTASRILQYALGMVSKRNFEEALPQLSLSLALEPSDKLALRTLIEVSYDLGGKGTRDLPKKVIDQMSGSLKRNDNPQESEFLAALVTSVKSLGKLENLVIAAELAQAANLNPSAKEIAKICCVNYLKGNHSDRLTVAVVVRLLDVLSQGASPGETFEAYQLADKFEKKFSYLSEDFRFRECGKRLAARVSEGNIQKQNEQRPDDILLERKEAENKFKRDLSKAITDFKSSPGDSKKLDYLESLVEKVDNVDNELMYQVYKKAYEATSDRRILAKQYRYHTLVLESKAKRLREQITNSPETPEMLSKLNELELDVKHARRSQLDIEHSENPENFDVALKLAVAYQEIGRVEDATLVYEKALGSSIRQPEDSVKLKMLFELGKIRFANGDFLEAEYLLAEGLKLHEETSQHKQVPLSEIQIYRVKSVFESAKELRSKQKALEAQSLIVPISALRSSDTDVVELKKEINAFLMGLLQEA